jgi:DNA-binding response OmpR family regulator
MLDSPTIARSRGVSPPRIVVADDDVDIRELIAIMLRSRGFDVVVAPDGDTALAVILSDGADGLVSDFQMPGLDGLTLCRVLRGLGAYVALPIVMFTGMGIADPRLLPLRDVNELRILHKPMGLREIAAALIEMIPATVTTDTSSIHGRSRNARRTGVIAGAFAGA